MSFLSKANASRKQAEDDDDDGTSGDEIDGAGPGPSHRPIPAQRREGGGGGGARAGGGGGAATNIAKLPIQIRTMDGKTYKIDAKTDWDVQRLKKEFEKWHGGNAGMCSLYYKAKKLQDNNSLLSYKIGAGDFVMANYRSVGGSEV